MSCPIVLPHRPAVNNLSITDCEPLVRRLVLAPYSAIRLGIHLKEIDHVLNQLTTAGAKIALHKGQWCKTKVNYVGLLVGRNGIKPQSNRTQAIQSIKTPTNVSELQSFLGLCNYSRQFIENYADIVRPLTSLLKNG